jgi:hypothetical protein
VNALDHGAALEHRGRAFQLQVLRPCWTAMRRILLRISRGQQFD